MDWLSYVWKDEIKKKGKPGRLQPWPNPQEKHLQAGNLCLINGLLQAALLPEIKSANSTALQLRDSRSCFFFFFEYSGQHRSISFTADTDLIRKQDYFWLNFRNIRLDMKPENPGC